jgi:hypothetical protein
MKQTVIFDCCHSGSGTRTEIDDPTRLIRSVEALDDIPAGLDRDIWDLEGKRDTTIPPGFFRAGLRSHVFLAACSAGEKAVEEQGRGLFTKALLDVLTTFGADKLRYVDVLERIHDLPG